MHFSFNFHSFPDRQAGRSFKQLQASISKSDTAATNKAKKEQSPAPARSTTETTSTSQHIIHTRDPQHLHTDTRLILQRTCLRHHLSGSSSSSSRQASKQASTTQPGSPGRVHQPTQQQQQAAPRSRPPSKRNQCDKEKQQI